MAYDNFDPEGGGLDVPGGCIVALLALLVAALLVWGLYSVGQWAVVQVEHAKASAEASRAEAVKAREEGKTERAKIALEKEKIRGINTWIDSLTARMNAATLMPFTPVLAILMILAAGAGYWIRGP